MKTILNQKIGKNALSYSCLNFGCVKYPIFYKLSNLFTKINIAFYKFSNHMFVLSRLTVIENYKTFFTSVAKLRLWNSF